LIPPILARYGTKTTMFRKIIELLPPHNVYIEPFGGVAIVLLNKPRSKREIYNDIDGNLVNFFRVLREKEKREKLKDMLRYTPYSREIYHESLNQDYDDDIWKAYYYFIMCNQGFRGRLFGGGWGISIKTNKGEEMTFRRKVDLIDTVANRLINVVIENRDYKEILEKYDKSDVVFYLDPPYCLNSEYYTGSDEYYGTNFDENEHKKLINLLLNLKGKAILSGYKNKLYEKLEENGWTRFDYKIQKFTSPKKRIEESLWINFDHNWW